MFITGGLLYSKLLLAEGNGALLRVHGIHNGQRLQVVTQVSNDTAADLEALFHNDAAAFHDGAGAFDDGNQALQGATVGQAAIKDGRN